MTSEAQRAYHREYYQKHREEIMARQKAYYEAHKEEILARQKAYYEAHKEEINAHKAAYQKAHPEKYREYKRKHKERKAREETCKILKEHKEALADDPERLSTDFILKLVQGGS